MLVKELEELKRSKNDIESELAASHDEVLSLSSKAEQARKEIDTAYQELEDKDDIVAGLDAENEDLKSALQKSEQQLAVMETDAMQALELTEAVQSQLKEKSDRYEQSKLELVSDLNSARQEITKLQKNAESSQTAWAQKVIKHSEEIENLKFRLEETVEEKEAQLIESEKLNSVVAQAGSELVTARTEIADLKSELANNIASAKQTADLQEQLEEAKDQAAISLTQIGSLTSEIEDIKTQLSLKTEELVVATTSQAKSEVHQTELNAQLKSFQHRANEAELELAETSESLAKQQTSYAELETTARQDRDELTFQLSKYSELEASVEPLKNQILETQRELSETANLLKQEKSTREEIEKTAGQQAEEVSVLSSAKSNIEAKLKPLEMRAKEAEQQLEETVKLLEHEQTQLAKIAKEAQDADAKQELQISKYAELEASVESRENQMLKAQQELIETANQLEQERSMREEIENTVKQQAEELSVLRSGKATIEAELKPLELRAQRAEKQLEESVKLRDHERVHHAEIAKTAQDADARLNSQLSRCLELETSIKSLEGQIQEAGEQLEQTTNELDKTKSLQIELEKTTEQQKAQLIQKEIQHEELETKLRETVESDDDALRINSEKLDRQLDELDELQIAFQNEKMQHSEVLKKLKSSQLRIADLEQQSQASSVNESNYIEMAKKVVKYKTAFQQSEARVQGLAEQKSRMSDLATEYLAVGKFLKGKLDAQLASNADLQRRLGNGSSNGATPAEFNRLVQERARVHILEVKANFEERIKKKNKIIRKLKNREHVQS